VIESIGDRFTVGSLAQIAFAAPFGLIFGSFVTALTYRLPRHESVGEGRSRCPKCGHVLGVRDLFPLFSWVVSGGACRHCGVAISRRYPVIEGVSLFLFMITAAMVHDPLRLALALAFIPLLLSLAVIDFEHQKVPDVLLGLLVPLVLGWRWQSDGGVGAGILAAAITLAATVGIGLLFRGATGESGMGLGDAKLISLAAYAFPPFIFFLFLAGASAMGLGLGVWWRRQTGQERFPFAVTIALGWWLCVILPLPVEP